MRTLLLIHELENMRYLTATGARHKRLSVPVDSISLERRWGQGFGGSREMTIDYSTAAS